METVEGIQVREIRDADIQQIKALWASAGLTRPWNDPDVDIAFARKGPHSTILVAQLANRICASAMVGEDGHRGWVYYVAADPAWRGKGLGRCIMHEAERWLQRRGVWKVQLLVREDNTGVKDFYSHIGYRNTGSVCFQKELSSWAPGSGLSWSATRQAEQ